MTTNRDFQKVIDGKERFAWVFGDSELVIPKLCDAVDAVVTDPPYPGIKRDYGIWNELQWFSMMDVQMWYYRLALKDRGSAMLIMQPNQDKIGSTRPWLYRFLADWATKWNIIQDAYWLNYVGLPQAGAARYGMLRSMLKFCAWFGSPDCYRDQKSILWGESEEGPIRRAAARCTKTDSHKSPSGHRRDRNKVHAASERRGGVTPFNVWPIANNRSETGHGAETPVELARRWIRYITPPDGIVLDPFGGGANIGVAALREGRRYIGIERFEPAYNLGVVNLAKESSKSCVCKDVEA